MSNDVYAILYLLYGFTFMLMGTYAIREYRKSYSVFPLMNGIVFLGIFGITHGFTEWLTMLQRANLFEAYHPEIFIIGRIIKAFSFLALIQFGLTLILHPSWRKLGTWLLGLYTISFLIAFFVIMSRQGFYYFYDNRIFFIISIRYLMAFPSALLSAGALIYHGLKVRVLDPIWMKYYFYLSFVIFIYGILDGLFVRRHGFFPANTFYNQWFIETLGIPNQLFKILIGFAFYHSISLVIKSFSWEKSHKLQKVRDDEEDLRVKEKVNQKLHDELIQSLFISGLNLQSMIDRCPDDETQENLESAINIMNDTIKTLREYILTNSVKNVSTQNIHDEISSMIKQTFLSSNIRVDFRDYLDEQGIHAIEKEVLKHLYFILRELLVNVIKHAEANQVKIVLYQEIKCLKLIVTDNGSGLIKGKERLKEKQGLTSIESRVDELGGTMKIHVKKKWPYLPTGTSVTVLIPLGVK